MTWEMVNRGGIEIPSTIDVWHAGRVGDMTKIHSRIPGDSFDNTILLATADSGVWMINESSVESKSLSVDWENTHVTCLETGPNGPHHIFAGCGNPSSTTGSFGGALYETNTSLPNSLIEPWLPIKLPTTPNIGSIFDIAVLKNLRIIVLACWDGLWWSRIPPIPGIPGGGVYIWERADWKECGIDGTVCYSITLGPGETIIAGAWSDFDTNLRGIFRGEFSRPLFSLTPDKPVDRLVMFKTEIDMLSTRLTELEIRGAGGVLEGYLPAKNAMLRVSVASCETQPKEVYALCTGPELPPEREGMSKRDRGQVNMVLRSSDGGRKWTICGTTIIDLPPAAVGYIQHYGDDNAGGIMHSICVDPIKPEKVAFGVKIPFISEDSGVTWKRIGTWDGTEPRAKHHHDDVHFVYFDSRSDRSDTTIYIGTDGGLTSTSDTGATFKSLYNKFLPNLQFYGRNTGGFYGKMCVSRVFPNFIGGGTHDNGNISCEIIGQQQKTTPWKKLTGGDGGQMVRIPLAHGDVVLYSFYGGNEDDRKPRHATWDTTKQMLENGGLIPGLDRDGNPISLIPVRSGSGEHISDSLPFSIMETIVDPKFRNRSGQPMLAVAAGYLNWDIFGLFADPSGADVHWEKLLPGGYYIPGLGSGAGSGSGAFALWSTCRAIGSLSGNRIFFSVFWDERVSSIYTFRPGEDTVFDFREILSPTFGGVPVGGFVSHIAIEDEDKIAYATYILHGSVTVDFPQGQSYLLRTKDGGRTWDRLFCPGIPRAAPGADANPILRGIDIDHMTTPATLYLATDKRVYVSTDKERNTWNDISTGLPNDPHCADLIFVDRRSTEGKKYLYLPTHGWSVWRVPI
jgi:hypothetical protein